MPCDARYEELHARNNLEMRNEPLHSQKLPEHNTIAKASSTFSNILYVQNLTGTTGEKQIVTLRIALALLATQVDKVDGLLTQLIEQNRDPYLAHRIKPAIQALRIANSTAARHWLERAVGYLQTRLVHRSEKTNGRQAGK
jgi:hypothetical protein